MKLMKVLLLKAYGTISPAEYALWCYTCRVTLNIGRLTKRAAQPIDYKRIVIRLRLQSSYRLR